MKGRPEMVVVAGEMSGDMHAARILRQLKKLIPGLRTWGFGGDCLAAEGMEIREHIRTLSVMGVWEVLKRYGYFRKVLRDLVREIRERKPSVVLTVDYPGFNLRLAKALQGSGIPVVQYVCPQVWAWKSGRIPMMAQVLTRLICIFPFEPELFKGTGLDARYLGHPLVDETLGTIPDTCWSGNPRLALVPGSRRQEIDRLFVPMLETAERLRRRFPNLSCKVPAASSALAQRMRELVAAHPSLPVPEIVDGHMREVVRGADAAVVTSGTATFETALLGTPMAIVYKTSALTYAIGRHVVKVPWIGMANILAGREICPEFIQGDLVPARIASVMEGLLEDSGARRAQIEALRELRSTLSSDEQGMRPAELLAEMF